MHLTHLESKTGHPAPLANRLGFAAGGKSARAHVAGEHLTAAPVPRRALPVFPRPRHAVEIGCRSMVGRGDEPVGGGGIWLGRVALNLFIYFF